VNMPEVANRSRPDRRGSRFLPKIFNRLDRRCAADQRLPSELRGLLLKPVAGASSGLSAGLTQTIQRSFGNTCGQLRLASVFLERQREANS
jgi:hypothetical protein